MQLSAETFQIGIRSAPNVRRLIEGLIKGARWIFEDFLKTQGEYLMTPERTIPPELHLISSIVLRSVTDLISSDSVRQKGFSNSAEEGLNQTAIFNGHVLDTGHDVVGVWGLRWRHSGGRLECEVKWLRVISVDVISL